MSTFITKKGTGRMKIDRVPYYIENKNIKFVAHLNVTFKEDSIKRYKSKGLKLRVYNDRRSNKN